MKQVRAENYRRFDAAEQPELQFGPGSPVTRSTIDSMIDSATYLQEVTRANLEYCVTPCLCDGTLGRLDCQRCNEAKTRRMRALLKPNRMKQRCGGADEQEINRNGT
jgi:hypothetical protein